MKWWHNGDQARALQGCVNTDPWSDPGSRHRTVTSDSIGSFQLPSRFQSQRVKLNIDLSLITGSLSSRDFGCGATFHETFHYDGDYQGPVSCRIVTAIGNCCPVTWLKYILMEIYLVTISAGELILGRSNVSHITCLSSSRHRLPVCVLLEFQHFLLWYFETQGERDKEGWLLRRDSENKHLIKSLLNHLHGSSQQ